MFTTRLSAILALTVLAGAIFGSQRAHAVDFHAFEFDEPQFSILSDAANTGSPGGQSWVEDNDLTDSFTDGSGNFVIRKFSDVDADNYLQIDNIDETTVGSRYIVARMSGWDFRGNEVGEGEGVWFAFLDNDTGTSGSTVTAQVLIDRNTTTEAIELRANAIGVGNRDIANRATLNTTQTDPFTMVLELNKTSNTYEVFYKDGTAPAQSLGMAPISPTRNGNSIRFAVNNNFNSDLDEFFSIDRIAVTDTNPLTDLMTLEVDRTSGSITLKNTTGSVLSGLRSYTITSNAGALDDANWKSITDFYDAAPGDGSVDSDDSWMETSSTTLELSEEVLGGDGGNLSNSQEVALSMGGGAWIKNPDEDLEIVLNFDGGISRRANVNFVGNGGKRFESGDLNFDGMLTSADWTTFIAGAETDLTDLSEAQAYQSGDLNNDGENNIFDFAIFKDAYDEANGSGSFAAMLAAIPEPTSASLLTLVGVCLLSRRTRQQPSPTKMKQPTPMKDHTMSYSKPAGLVLLASLFLLVLPRFARAEILEEFTFDEANGTLLADTLNTGTPGNMWGEDAGDMSGSTVQNGLFHIQKDNDRFGTNFLDIEDITSGKVWLVAEISGWNFSSLVGPGEFDSGEREQIRFGFLQNDGNDQGGNTVTAEVEIERISSGGLEVNGVALGDGGPIPPQTLGLTQAEPYTVVLALDKDSNNYEIFTKSGEADFASLGGPAPVDSTRDGNSIRFVANNNFSGTGEFFDIDRIYLTDTDPTNVVTDRLTLEVNTLTGELKLLNDTATTFDIDSYRMTSATGDLNLAGWNSLSDHVPAIDPVDGPDADSDLGNGIGETWDEAGGASASALAESFLLGSSVFGNGREESLGQGFKVGGDTNSLLFQYRNADSGAIVEGNIAFVSTGPSADYDHDGDVDGQDFLVWQRGGSPNPLSAGDLSAWQAQYGTGAGQAVATSVPEPTTLVLAGLVLLVGTAARKRA